MFSGNSDFGCFSPFDPRIEHPDVMDFDSLFMEVSFDVLVSCLFVEIRDAELPEGICPRRDTLESACIISPNDYCV